MRAGGEERATSPEETPSREGVTPSKRVKLAALLK